MDEHITAVTSGQMTGSDLADFVDGKLVSDMLTPEGAAFSDWYYDRYLTEYQEAFAGANDFAVSDDAEAADRIFPVLDRRHDEWIDSGRPKPTTGQAGAFSSLPDLQNMTIAIGPSPAGALDAETRELLDRTLATAFPGASLVEMKPPAPPHDAPHVEAMFPRDLTAGPFDVRSSSASSWHDAVLNKVLQQLGVKPTKAMVAIAMSGRGEGMLTMSITSIPGIDRESLWSLLPRLEKAPGGRCDVRVVADRRVRWCTYAEFGIKATWASDGLVVWASARDPEIVQAAIAQLP